MFSETKHIPSSKKHGVTESTASHSLRSQDQSLTPGSGTCNVTYVDPCGVTEVRQAKVGREEGRNASWPTDCGEKHEGKVGKWI